MLFSFWNVILSFLWVYVHPLFHYYQWITLMIVKPFPYVLLLHASCISRMRWNGIPPVLENYKTWWVFDNNKKKIGRIKCISVLIFQFMSQSKFVQNLFSSWLVVNQRPFYFTFCSDSFHIKRMLWKCMISVFAWFVMCIDDTGYLTNYECFNATVKIFSSSFYTIWIYLFHCTIEKTFIFCFFIWHLSIDSCHFTFI